MKNSDKFIDYYNKIDTHLRSEGGYEKETSFAHIVKNSKNKAAKRYKDELISLGELRNAISHHPRIDGEVIAEPHEKTVVEIEDLHQKITDPKKVIPKFQSEVLGAQKEDFINEILVKMREKSFSQFPVFDENGEVCELISNNTISRWLCMQLEENGTVMVEKVKVADLISEIEFEKNYKFVPRNTSIYEAYELFINQINEQRRNLDAILITENGKASERLMGLITIEDIANLV